MQISVNPIDSRVFRRTVLDLRDVAVGEDLTQIERDYLVRYDPIYVCCKMPIGLISGIHALEEVGFRFVEYQLQMSCHVNNPYDVSGYPYRFERVTTEDSLAPILEIASTAFCDDRFSIDPLVPPGASGRRYRMYVIKSFSADDERVYRLVNDVTDETVAFKTHRILGPDSALCLLGATKAEYRETPLSVINGQFESNMLRDLGFAKSSRMSPAGTSRLWTWKRALWGSAGLPHLL